MTKRHLVIATRESPLALRQTEWVKARLLAIHPHLSIEFLGITTEGDKKLDVRLSKIGGKGLFVKELEAAMLDGRADMAVHSMKDVPMELLPEFDLSVICEREDPRDAFVANDYRTISELPRGAVVGTSSLRRETQLRAIRSDLNFKSLRGNVNTRLAKLDAQEYDAIILASAGLKRMQFQNRIKSYLSYEESLPAAGQGALGIECKTGDEATLALIRPLNNEKANVCVTAERALCRRLGGGCSVPIAAFAECHKDELTITGLVASADGKRVIKSSVKGKPSQAESLGTRCAEELIQNGVEKILKEFHALK